MLAHGGADQVKVPLLHKDGGHNPGDARRLRNVMSGVMFQNFVLYFL